MSHVSTSLNGACRWAATSQLCRRSRLVRSAVQVPKKRDFDQRSKSHNAAQHMRTSAAAVELEAPPSQGEAWPAPPSLAYRVGHGFDLHRLEEGPYKLILGGIEIPHDRGCIAHSDGDALLHTITDAILGALGQPDIGQLFPDNDPKWKGQTSDVFVKEAVRLMREAGYVMGNLDATIILQKPKLSPHKETIRLNLCRLLEAHPSTVNLKAKTHEKVDSLGENRSIGCHAVVMLIRKDVA
eukprot:jgi/Botrbrau1/9936/Bobra.0012s0033.1